MRKTSAKNDSVKEASANLFAEFGLPSATEKNAKIQLAVTINNIVASRKLLQRDAARFMRCNQPDVSALAHYNLKIFSIERLLDFLLFLNNDVEITIRPVKSRKRPPKTIVRMARSA